MEVSRAPYERLLRVPGIGIKSARRIVAARRQGALTFESLRRMGVVLKRARYFITCQGRMEPGIRLDADYIARALSGGLDGGKRGRLPTGRIFASCLCLMTFIWIRDSGSGKEGAEIGAGIVFLEEKDDDGICMRTGA